MGNQKQTGQEHESTGARVAVHAGDKAGLRATGWPHWAVGEGLWSDGPSCLVGLGRATAGHSMAWLDNGSKLRTAWGCRPASELRWRCGGIKSCGPRGNAAL